MLKAVQVMGLLCCGWFGSMASGQYLRGVNLAGAEFGEMNIPGVFNHDYTFNSETSFAYFAARSLGLMRIPFFWERVQPVLRGPLDAAYLGLLKQNVAWANAHGNRVVLDLHNFARYRFNEGGKLNEYVIDNVYGGVVRVSSADLADVWARLSNEFHNEPAVYAYGLMNEPHDMGTADWRQISQIALNAIRNTGDTKLTTVPGNDYANADLWPLVNGPVSWIVDPANNFVYEAHTYFDRDYSGSYARTYDQELALDPTLPTRGQQRLKKFTDWCQTNHVRGYLGEYGVPNTDARWLTVLDGFLAALDTVGLDGTYWAAGEWWNGYTLSVQPLNNFTVDRPQLAVLEGHLPPRSFTTVSAASSSGFAFAPDSLVTGYGSGLAPGTEAASMLPLPTSLANAEVDVMDSTGVSRPAPLVFVSPGQINYLIPPQTAAGRLDVTVRVQGNVTGTGTFSIASVAPALFSSNADGRGIAAAQVVRVKSDGTQTYEAVASFDPAQNRFVAAPIDFGASTDRLFLLLYGTGFRRASAATLKIGAVDVPVQFAGAQPVFSGLDQVNAELPRALMGVGEVTVLLKADGKPANAVTLAFR
jgi:endoglucanase